MILETYKFNEVKKHKEFKNVSGIYALIYNNEVIYVGQSVDVRKRLMRHFNLDSNIQFYSKPCGFKPEARRICLSRYLFIKQHIDEILFLVLPLPINELNGAERQYINKYKPRFNYSGVRDIYKPVYRAS